MLLLPICKHFALFLSIIFSLVSVFFRLFFSLPSWVWHSVYRTAMDHFSISIEKRKRALTQSHITKNENIIHHEEKWQASCYVCMFYFYFIYTLFRRIFCSFFCSYSLPAKDVEKIDERIISNWHWASKDSNRVCHIFSILLYM